MTHNIDAREIQERELDRVWNRVQAVRKTLAEASELLRSTEKRLFHPVPHASNSIVGDKGAEQTILDNINSELGAAHDDANDLVALASRFTQL